MPYLQQAEELDSETILAQFYKLYDKPDHFQSVIYPNTGHVYNDDEKSRMVAWFDKHLK